MVALLIGSHFWYPADAMLPRYDALTIAAILIQALLIALRLEEWDEVAVILLFHIAGTGMELFKTAVGSWIYPEFAYLRVGGVPLFSGFMYASVGSYITRACRGFGLRFSNHPSLAVTCLLSIAISMVSMGKLGSWFMLTVMSYVMVTLINRPRELEHDARASSV